MFAFLLNTPHIPQSTPGALGARNVCARLVQQGAPFSTMWGACHPPEHVVYPGGASGWREAAATAWKEKSMHIGQAGNAKRVGRPYAAFGIQTLMPVWTGLRPVRIVARVGLHDGCT